MVHDEPITVQVVGGKDGQPLGRLHLVLIAGYDRSDMKKKLFYEDALTDAHGQVRLSKQMANLPWLQVWVDKKTLCQENPRIASFSVDLMRHDGLSTPNRCGKATVEDRPGLFTVFVKGKGLAPAAPAQTAAPPAVAATATQPAAMAASGATSAAVGAVCSCSCPKKKHRCGPACKSAKTVARGVAWYLR